MFGKKFIKPPTDKQVVGRVGEDLACDYLRKEGYSIIDRNYSKKWGELDIVTKLGKKIHFVEVKTVSRNVIRETFGSTYKSDYRPEDNMHPWKLKRLSRAVQTYLLDKNVPDDVDWQFDVVTVYVDSARNLLKVEYLDDVVL